MAVTLPNNTFLIPQSRCSWVSFMAVSLSSICLKIKEIIGRIVNCLGCFSPKRKDAPIRLTSELKPNSVQADPVRMHTTNAVAGCGRQDFSVSPLAKKVESEFRGFRINQYDQQVIVRIVGIFSERETSLILSSAKQLIDPDCGNYVEIFREIAEIPSDKREGVITFIKSVFGTVKIKTQGIVRVVSKVYQNKQYRDHVSANISDYRSVAESRGVTLDDVFLAGIVTNILKQFV